jgi:hypothetical protein
MLRPLFAGSVKRGFDPFRFSPSRWTGTVIAAIVLSGCAISKNGTPYGNISLSTRRTAGFVPALIALLFAAAQAYAGDIEPRAYFNTPVGINFLLAGYAYSDGGLSTAGSSPIQDAEPQIHTGVLAYARTLDVWGKSGKFDVLLPYSKLSGSARVAGQPRERNVPGLSDPLFRFSVNFYGAPALSLQEFANYRQDLIVGASIQVSAPLGQYNKDKLVNLGNNRWFVKPEIGVSKAWGALTLELSTGVFFFGKNDEYFGGKALEQDSVSSTQVHVTYNFGRGIWAAFSGTYDYGGRTTVDGVGRDNLQKKLASGRHTWVAREPEQLDQAFRQQQRIHQFGE